MLKKSEKDEKERKRVKAKGCHKRDKNEEKERIQ
jgi:hypothetical protein